MDEFLIIFATVFLLPATIVFINSFYADRERKLRYELLRTALGRGAILPMNLFDTPRRKSSRYGKLGWGSALTMLGLAVGVVLPIINGKEMDVFVLTLIGLPLLAVGLGLLLAFWVQYVNEKKNKPESEPQDMAYISFAAPDKENKAEKSGEADSNAE